ncbi:MAG: UvrD-helicase domain-containing protein [Rickettsiales bacterium]|jgi:DNA helicase-2/ATP-dependent DNA helicase PcrA|nr:UvrD-helicase domain-containing protein [Rickettsiales bacterium]
MRINEVIESLNPEQRQAVLQTDGALLVLSGAGTGKTKVLTSRIAYILSQKKAWPSEIMALTFTNKAAAEMKDRVAKIVNDGSSDGLWLGTFHSICLRIMRQHIGLCGRDKNFVIFDTDDQKRLLKNIMLDEFKIDIKKTTPSFIAETISRYKDRGVCEVDTNMMQDSLHIADGNFVAIYARYQERLLQMNAVDFGDLLLYPLKIFAGYPDILLQYQQKFKYVMVDEYQDTNTVQYAFLKLISAGHGNICCVGDDDQSIYSWRGAEIENILRFEHDFTNSQIIRLETNYRSTRPILECASELIANNKGRLGKRLFPCEQNAGDGDIPVQVRGVFSDKDETRSIRDEIEYYSRKGFSTAKMAVLVRAGWQTRTFEETFIKSGIPYKIIGGTKFYERQEIKDVVSYLRLLVYPTDDLSFARIINLPRRGIGDKTVGEIHKHARMHGISMFMATEQMLKDGFFSSKLATVISKFVNDFYQWRGVFNGSITEQNGEAIHHGKLIQSILHDSGYLDMWYNAKTPDAQGRIENIRELVGTITAEFESLSEFLEHASLVMATDEYSNGDEVSIMTLHASKGLEFDIVFLPGWETGIFPNEKAIEDGGLEEERRLAYVGITRGRKVVIIYYAGSRMVFGQWQNNLPSQFIKELPQEFTEHSSFSSAFMG